jgi:hypothetical protein
MNSSSAQGAHTKIDLTLSHKTNVNTFQKLKSYRLSIDNNGIKVEISNLNIGKSQNTWKLNTTSKQSIGQKGRLKKNQDTLNQMKITKQHNRTCRI